MHRWCCTAEDAAASSPRGLSSGVPGHRRSAADSSPLHDGLQFKIAHFISCGRNVTVLTVGRECRTGRLVHSAP